MAEPNEPSKPEDYQASAWADAQATNWRSRLKTKGPKDNQLSATLYNIALLLQYDDPMAGVLRFDEFSHQIIKARTTPWATEPGQWSDLDETMAALWLSEVHDINASERNLQRAVQAVAFRRRFNPVIEWLESLEWDGTPRVDTWLAEYLGACDHYQVEGDKDRKRYVSRAGRYWLISAVARAFRPGCKADHVLILEGKQGRGKSSALRILAGEWFSDTPISLQDKDAYMQVQGCLIVELAELDALNKVEATRAKAFFSSAQDTYRPPFGRHVVKMPRQCVFAGTTNLMEYLRDPTGNRRYWPVTVHRAELDALRRDREQLWAEALHLYLEGYDHHPMPEERDLFSLEQDDRQIIDPWEEALAVWLDEAEQKAPDARWTTQELLRSAVKVDMGRMDERGMSVRIGRCAARLGLVRCQATTTEDRAAGRRYYYRRKTEIERQRDAEEDSTLSP